MLNLKHLYYYHIFARELSTTKAAKYLRITSPALSNQLKQLESFLAVPLTRRIGGKVVITEHGDIVRNYTNRMFSAYDELKEKLSSNQNLKTSRFRVGISQNLGARFSFDLLSLLEKTNLSLSQNVQITFDSSHRLLEEFDEGQFDLVLGSFAHQDSKEIKCVSQNLAFPVRLFAPPSLMDGIGHNAKQLIAADLSQIMKRVNLKKMSLVLPTGPSVLRDETEAFLLNSEITPLKTIECNTSSGIVQLIERGFALGFAPTPSLLDFKSARTLDVLGPPEGYWVHEVSVYIHRSEEIAINLAPNLDKIFEFNSAFI